MGDCRKGSEPMRNAEWLLRFPGRCYFYEQRDCPGWSAGGTCSRIGDEIPADAGSGDDQEAAE